MNALRTRTEAVKTRRAGYNTEAMSREELTYYVHLIDGTVREVAPATGLRLTNTEILFVLGEVVVARLPRREVYFAACQHDIPPFPP